MQNNDKKVLLRISNLKQYFPLKGGRFVKANDGITLDIYEGETFGLVGESGCGKSTLGRTILQLYHQTYGRTMYYGRSLDDLAPKYVIDTVKNLKARRTKLRELEQKRDKLEAEYAKLSEKEQYAKHGELDAARKLAEDALLDITKIVGGFLVVDNLDPVIAAYSKDYAIAHNLSSMEEKRQELQVDVDDAEYAKKTAEKAGKSAKDGQLQRAQEKLNQLETGSTENTGVVSSSISADQHTGTAAGDGSMSSGTSGRGSIRADHAAEEQLSFITFSEHPAVEMLRKLDIMSLTPSGAIAVIEQLKKAVEDM